MTVTENLSELHRLFHNKLTHHLIYLSPVYEKLVAKILFKPENHQITPLSKLFWLEKAYRNILGLKNSRKKGGLDPKETLVSDQGLGVTSIKRDELH